MNGQGPPHRIFMLISTALGGDASSGTSRVAESFPKDYWGLDAASLLLKVTNAEGPFNDFS